MLSTDRQKPFTEDALIFGCHSPLPAQRQQRHQKKPFCSFSIWGGMFAKGLILASWFVPAVPRIPRGSHSQAVPTLGLLSPPQAVFCWHGVEPANPATPMFSQTLPMLCLQSNKISFCSFQQRKQETLTKVQQSGRLKQKRKNQI